MNEWTKAQEADFQELIHRASEQSRECYGRRSEEPPSPPRVAECKPEQPVRKPPPVQSRGSTPMRSPQTTRTPAAVCTPTPICTPVPVCTPVPAPVCKPELPCIIGGNSGAGAQRNEQRDRGQSGKTANRQEPAGSPSKKSTPKGLAGIMEKLDNEGLMLAALLWILMEEKADTSIILAVAYILLV